MKNILLLVLVLACGCRTQRVVSQTTTTDSTTTITQRPVSVVIKPDTASEVHNLTTFAHTFDKAAVGAVIAQKRKGSASYTIRKTSTDDFEVEAVAAGKDTTVLVSDTNTVVKKHTKQVVKDEPTWIGRVLHTSKNVLIIGLLLVLLVLGLIRKLLN